MTQEQINLLTISELHLLRSTRTKEPYISAENACYMFESMTDAEQFLSIFPDTAIDPKKRFNQGEFATGFYSLGIETIRLMRKGAKEFITLTIEEKDIKRPYFYNHIANQLVLRLLEEQSSGYLREMKDIPFLAPVCLDVRMPKQYPIIHYCYAKADANEQFYILFTTMREFDEWNRSNGEKWSPLEITLFEFGHIRGQHKVIINPMKHQLILTDAQISKYIGRPN